MWKLAKEPFCLHKECKLQLRCEVIVAVIIGGELAMKCEGSGCEGRYVKSREGSTRLSEHPGLCLEYSNFQCSIEDSPLCVPIAVWPSLLIADLLLVEENQWHLLPNSAGPHNPGLSLAWEAWQGGECNQREAWVRTLSSESMSEDFVIPGSFSSSTLYLSRFWGVLPPWDLLENSLADTKTVLCPLDWILSLARPGRQVPGLWSWISHCPLGQPLASSSEPETELQVEKRVILWA